MGTIKVDDTLQENQIIRRYIDFYKLFDLISNKQLYLCRIDKLEDKYEGDYPVPLYDFNKNITITDNRNDKTISGADNLNIQREHGIKSAYINCWNKRESESMALWKIYASGSSVAIETTIEKLRNALQNSRVKHISRDGKSQLTQTLNLYNINLVTVEYFNMNGNASYTSNDYIDMYKNPVFPLNLKHHGYDFEQEVRIILKEIFSGTCSDKSHIFIEIHPSSLIDKIIVSPTAHDEFYKSVKNLIDINNFEINIDWSEFKYAPHQTYAQ